jgi:hypothetical protein
MKAIRDNTSSYVLVFISQNKIDLNDCKDHEDHDHSSEPKIENKMTDFVV